MSTASPSSLSSASTRKYVELTKLRYRVVFALVMLAAAYYLPFSGHLGDTAIRPGRMAMQTMFFALSLWTFWSSRYVHYSDWTTLNTVDTLRVLFSVLCANVFLLFGACLNLAYE